MEMYLKSFNTPIRVHGVRTGTTLPSTFMDELVRQWPGIIW